MTTSPGVLSRPIFLLLPAELRNTIYGLIFWDTYKSIALNSQAEKAPDADDLAILRVSRATTNEALAIFYTECTFKFHIDCGDDRFIMPSIEMTAKLKKVIFDVVGDGKYYLQRRQLQSAAEAFMDIRTIRDCMVVEVNMVEGIEYCNHDRLIHDALCELLSLRSLIIKFLLFKEPKQNQIWEESCIFLQRRIKRSLEEDLGPAMEGRTEGISTTRYYGFLDFHPLTHSAECLIRKADIKSMMTEGIHKEAESMREKARMLGELV